MFAIGEAVTEVKRDKVQLPKSYGLGKRGRKIYAAWFGERTLYLSDEKAPLKAKAGRGGNIFEARIDASSQLTVPGHFDGEDARIEGCISTIRIEFMPKSEGGS
ncbi:MAG: hypothetical protein HFI93_00240 [Lachnospiraceae bacterium]|nr:hypothetical protein [Lachnospiraceae bacterium]